MCPRHPKKKIIDKPFGTAETKMDKRGRAQSRTASVESLTLDWATLLWFNLIYFLFRSSLFFLFRLFHLFFIPRHLFTVT